MKTMTRTMTLAAVSASIITLSGCADTTPLPHRTLQAADTTITSTDLNLRVPLVKTGATHDGTSLDITIPEPGVAGWSDLAAAPPPVRTTP